MKIKVDGQDWEVEKETKISEILAKLGIRPETVIPVRNKEILTSEDTVFENDEIFFKKVIAGG